jgi:hypothetical protein
MTNLEPSLLLLSVYTVLDSYLRTLIHGWRCFLWLCLFLYLLALQLISNHWVLVVRLCCWFGGYVDFIDAGGDTRWFGCIGWNGTNKTWLLRFGQVWTRFRTVGGSRLLLSYHKGLMGTSKGKNEWGSGLFDDTFLDLSTLIECKGFWHPGLLVWLPSCMGTLGRSSKIRWLYQL